ncbi:MAG: RNB domain-containing ribonuclease, partial [Sphingobium sp.]
LKDYLATYDISFALGQVVKPATFNRLIAQIGESDFKAMFMEQILRTQMQASYGPQNAGHFGLSLGSYAHFTSPIRRYADLLVHRALVGSHDLEMPKPKDNHIADRTSLSGEDMANMGRVGELISQHERRAMEAERETVDRYVAAYLAKHVGEVMPTRITGVQSFGFFATVDGLGGDGLVPVSTLGAERFNYIEASRALEGANSGDRYTVGQKIELRLVEADPINGSLRFELPEGASHLPMRRGLGTGRGRPFKSQGRPSNIRHSNNPRGKNKR